jgi:hypothetical protein
MDMIITMIILTGAAVLFLSNVFRQVRDERERAQQRGATPRRPPSTTEQFLEEVNRRRQQASDRGRPSPPVRRDTLITAPPPAVRRETPVRKSPPKVDRPRQATVPPRTTSRVPPTQLMEVVPVEVPADYRQPAGELIPVQPSSEPTHLGAVGVTDRRPPLLLAQLTPLLRSRQTLRAAFLLHEILGPPRCYQKKARPR